MVEKLPKPPAGAKSSGKRLWTSVLEVYDLEAHEELLLVQAVRLADLLDSLHATTEAEGAVILGQEGGAKVHPAVPEARQCQLALARVLAALRLPAGVEGDAARRPQRRTGVRGVYGLGGVA